MSQPSQLTPLIKTELLVQTDISREYYNNIVNHQTAIVMLDCMRYVFTESIKKPVLPDIAQKFNICLININMYSPVFFDKYMSLLNNLLIMNNIFSKLDISFLKLGYFSFQ